MPPDFKKLVIARFLFTFAVQMQAVVLGWRIFELLRDPLALGMIGLAEAVPAIGLALYAGFLVDRMKPLLVYRRVILGSLLSGAVVLVEHLLADQLAIPTQAGLLYFAAFLTGTARAFSQPAIFATVPRLVPRADLTRATATSSSTMQAARIAGPAIGGLVFGFFGPITASTLVCVFLAVGVFVMSLIRTELAAPETRAHHASIGDELLSGARFVWRHPILFPALTLDMISVLFGGVTGLLPIFADDVLHVGREGLGALRAAPAVGATLMGIYLARNVGFRSGWALLIAVTGFGLCILVFGYSQSFWLSMAALGLSGMFDSVSMVIRSTAVQLTSPAHMRGKISAVNSIFIGSSNEIGELESGLAAKLLGVQPAVFLGGIVCLATVALVGWGAPTLRKMDLEQLEPPSTA